MIIFHEKPGRAMPQCRVDGHSYLLQDAEGKCGATRKFEPTIVNMGINSGKVFLGATKFEGMSASRWTFTASGLTTVLAARIAGLATEGRSSLAGDRKSIAG